MSERISFTVPLTPPGVNHYVKHTRTGRHYTTGEAGAFKDAVAIYAKGQYVQAKRFTVNIQVQFAKGQKGDVDGFPKLVMDGLADCGVFRDKQGKRVSDAHVKRMCVEILDRERTEQGWTWIEVEAQAAFRVKAETYGHR